MMAAMQSLHGVRVSLETSPDGDYGEGGLVIVAIAWRQTEGIGGQVRCASVKCRYPHRDTKTLEGAMYRLCHELDRECGKLWSQTSF